MLRSVLSPIRPLTRGLATTIPIKGVARMVRIKCAGEPEAIKAQELLYKVHAVLKKEKGFVGSTRFVCKSEWDMMIFFRFADLDSLKAYMGSETKAKKVDPLLKELEAHSLVPPHSQNFVADDV